LACNACGSPIDPALSRNGELDDEGARVFGGRIAPDLAQWVTDLQSDALAAFGGAVPRRSWGLVRSADRLIDAIRELAVCIIVATRTKFIARVELLEPQAGQVAPLAYEPITLASLRYTQPATCLVSSPPCSQTWRPAEQVIEGDPI
jgi:hypothetical protein